MYFFLLAIIAYFSNAKNFLAVFKHVFILLFVVNLYDLIVLDICLFNHSKKSIIPGTEDMNLEYKKKRHNIFGVIVGLLIGFLTAPLSATIVYGFN